MSDEIHCPLCDYDLRGQVEPRCPECGYRFKWEDLRDPTLRLHPYLFEHHPERNIRSFFRTLAGGLRPRKFWSTLYPTQPSRPLRLIVYLALLSAFTLIPAIANMGFRAMQVWSENEQYRAGTLRNIQGPSGARWKSRFGSGMTPQQIVDRIAPQLTRRQLFEYAWRFGGFRTIVYMLIPMLTWPLLTLAAMMIFQWSMMKARVRPMHVVRCVIYSADVVFWINLAIGFGLISSGIARITGGTEFSPDPALIYFILALCGWLVFAYRFSTALRLYLQFDHPISTVLATQIIVALAAFTLILHLSV